MESDPKNSRRYPAPVPKQPRPPKVPRSLRLRPHLDEQVQAKAARLGLNFNEAVEHALEEWVRKDA